MSTLAKLCICENQCPILSCAIRGLACPHYVGDPTYQCHPLSLTLYPSSKIFGPSIGNPTEWPMGPCIPFCNRSKYTEDIRIPATLTWCHGKPWPWSLPLCHSLSFSAFLRPVLQNTLPVLQNTMISLQVPPSTIQEEGDANFQLTFHKESLGRSLSLGKQTWVELPPFASGGEIERVCNDSVIIKSMYHQLCDNYFSNTIYMWPHWLLTKNLMGWDF